MIEIQKYIGRNDKNTSFEGKYYLKDENKTIGYFNIEKIDWICRWVKISVMIEKTWEDMKSFIEVIMNYLYNELNLLKIKIEVYSNEKDLIITFKELGFKVEGCFKNEKYLNGAYLDLICFASFRGEIKVSPVKSYKEEEEIPDEEIQLDDIEDKHINTKRIGSLLKLRLNKSVQKE